MPDGRLLFRWDILEEGDGAKIQILLEGEPEAKFKVSGEIVGQRGGIREFKVKEKPPVSETGWMTRRRGTWLGGLAIALVALIFPWLVEDNFNQSARSRRIARRIGWLITLGAWAGVAWGLYSLAVDYSLPFTF